MFLSYFLLFVPTFILFLLIFFLLYFLFSPLFFFKNHLIEITILIPYYLYLCMYCHSKLCYQGIGDVAGSGIRLGCIPLLRSLAKKYINNNNSLPSCEYLQKRQARKKVLILVVRQLSPTPLSSLLVTFFSGFFFDLQKKVIFS